MIVDCDREGFIRAELPEQYVLEGTESSRWHVVGLMSAVREGRGGAGEGMERRGVEGGGGKWRTSGERQVKYYKLRAHLDSNEKLPHLIVVPDGGCNLCDLVWVDGCHCPLFQRASCFKV